MLMVNLPLINVWYMGYMLKEGSLLTSYMYPKLETVYLHAASHR